MIAKKGAPFGAKLKPSKKMQQLIIVMHLIALFATIASALPLAVKLFMALLIGLNFKAIFPIVKTDHRIIRYSEHLGWEIFEGDTYKSITVLKSTVTTPFLSFLHIQGKPAIVIACDALSEDDYRQLLVKLKMTVR